MQASKNTDIVNGEDANSPSQENTTSIPNSAVAVAKISMTKPGQAKAASMKKPTVFKKGNKIKLKGYKNAMDVPHNDNEDFMGGLSDFVDGFKLVDDDAEPEQIEKVALLASTTMDDMDDGSIAYADVAHADVKDEIRVPRELGIGTTVSICNDIVICNCEMFTRWKICRHCIYFEFLHCRTFPQGNATDGNTSYPRMRDSILSHIKNIDI